ncbi:hypothetical protein DFP72DRAFT_912640 [Ephemerocybe angulata]|uniref:Uncharacterized protein n=1 Tax=Ephemerocybe angulata TaxID=980116 RepID=A0A8H6HNK4_9AGAR|nr:hypothetical protein DFP72DRAFT_912640 [Tulosesus angulatus]
MSAITTTEDIVQNADYHAKLLRENSDLEYSSSALRQHLSYLEDLEAQLAASEKKVAELVKATNKERKEHERLEGLNSAQKEQFEANQAKEEREYMEALQKEMVERDQNAVIQQLLKEARSVKEELTAKTKRYESIKSEIESLYARVFEGPSESFPEEDRLEYDPAELLARAVVSMDKCQASVKEALSYSRYGVQMLTFQRSVADMMERNALTNATAQADQAQNFVEQARRINPVVQSVGHVNIASGSLMSDVFFDNIFTDMAFHDKIKKSAAQVLLTNNRLKQERDAALQRADVAGRTLELFYLRKALFESVASHVPQPPSYDNVTTMPQPSVAPPVPGKNGLNAYPAPSGPPPGAGANTGPHPANASPGASLYPPPTGPPPAFQSSESLHKTGQSGEHGSGSRIPQIDGASTSGGTPESRPQSPPRRNWGTRNPYAALLAERSRSMSDS